MKPQLQLYAIFHLNLAFSSIEEAQRPEIIKRCYWPLLRLVREFNFPVGIELTGYTLENINTLDPLWVVEFKSLLNTGSLVVVIHS